MVQGARGLGFALETAEGSGVAGRFFGKNFRAT
jgi:hypothetical protein